MTHEQQIELALAQSLNQATNNLSFSPKKQRQSLSVVSTNLQNSFGLRGGAPCLTVSDKSPPKLKNSPLLSRNEGLFSDHVQQRRSSTRLTPTSKNRKRLDSLKNSDRSSDKRVNKKRELADKRRSSKISLAKQSKILDHFSVSWSMETTPSATTPVSSKSSQTNQQVTTEVPRSSPCNSVSSSLADFFSSNEDDVELFDVSNVTNVSDERLSGLSNNSTRRVEIDEAKSPNTEEVFQPREDIAIEGRFRG